MRKLSGGDMDSEKSLLGTGTKLAPIRLSSLNFESIAPYVLFPKTLFKSHDQFMILVIKNLAKIRIISDLGDRG